MKCPFSSVVLSSLLFLGALTVADGQTAPSVLILGKQDLTSAQRERLEPVTNLLLMIPGISSGHMDDNRAFLERIQQESGHDLAVFYDWEAGNLTRKIAMFSTTDAGAAHLVDLLATIQGTRETPVTVDVIAHSIGSVLLNKAAVLSVHQNAGITFRHVLLMGTALDTGEALEDLKYSSASILNLHSAYDKVNRSINHNLGFLEELDSGVYTNLRIDYSLSGRIMRHYTFLETSPETALPYGHYLRTGAWPEDTGTMEATLRAPSDVYLLCRRVRDDPACAPGDLANAIPDLLSDPRPDIQYFGLILAGLTDATNQLSVIMEALEAPETPAYVRKEAYQALGNFEDGGLILFLKRARKRDDDCQEEIRDILRALKRKRVERTR
ncbi:MAG: hypothetical protein EOM20_05265 [Spartobacteria bacterium]|nr:hypothetical protein [Spartobacteria bacterium]